MVWMQQYSRNKFQVSSVIVIKLVKKTFNSWDPIRGIRVTLTSCMKHCTMKIKKSAFTIAYLAKCLNSMILDDYTLE